ncbi:hypothetical protein SynBIOSE41_00745 [Synechococcus sp. BIOS-E4-1]|nr:hypothetical protein SynBIOSE41_00745 [Synechococcus sp. BIOS-E4-1]
MVSVLIDAHRLKQLPGNGQRVKEDCSGIWENCCHGDRSIPA